MTKVKILILGPTGCGKTRISNYLADATNGSLPPELRPTHGVRILEFDVLNLKVDNSNIHVDVQLWDCSGDERYMTCWPAIKKNANGVVFVYSPNDTSGARKLDLYYNYFVNQQGFSPRQCIVFANHIDNEENEVQPNVKLSSAFSRMSQATVNMESSSEKLRYDFNQFLISVVNSVNNNNK